jgi:hypothetical protein
MVTTSTKAALNCGSMELAWRKWKRHPLVDHMWNNWKLHWTAVFAETHNINRMIPNNSAFANQAATNAKQAAMMAKSLDNLANVAIQKNEALEKLVTANEKLAKALCQRQCCHHTTPSPKSSKSFKSSVNSIKEFNKQSLTITLVSHQVRLGPYRLLFNTRAYS